MDLIYRQTMAPRVRDCDMYKRLKPSALFELFQDANQLHTEALGFGNVFLEQHNLLWVIGRSVCQIEHMPVFGQTIHLTAWNEKPKMGLYSWQYRLTDERDNELVRANSLWVLVDKSTRTMLMQTPDYCSITYPQPPEEPYNPRIRMHYAGERSVKTLQTTYTDTDQNGHISNLRYLDWVSDLPGSAFHRSHELASLAIDYRSEIMADESIQLEWAMNQNKLYCSGEQHFIAVMEFKDVN